MTIFRQLVYYVAQKAAADPETREKATKIARDAVKRTQQIAKDDNPAYTAGRAVRQAYDKLRNRR
jgi:hypothetical protein